MDADTALELVKKGATLLFLDVPQHTLLGIDTQMFSVGPNFKGIKMIPPGPHFIYYSSSNRGGSEFSPMIGFFIDMNPSEVIIRKWDQQEERLVKVSEEEEERYSLAVQGLEFDRFLGPYTLSQFGEWKMLSNYITKSTIERIGIEVLIFIFSCKRRLCPSRIGPLSIKAILFLFSIIQYLSFGSIAGKSKNMVQTRNSDSSNPPDAIAAQLAAIAAKLESIETMKEDIAALKEGERSKGSKNDEWESSWRGRQQHRPYKKIDFPIFGGGDPRGWLLKGEKYFRYYEIPDEEKVEIASMHLEGDALDLYSWLSGDHQITFWEELVEAFNRNFGPAEFQNPDEFLCSIKQTGSIHEYRQEFVKRSSRVSNWPDHCLLGVFLNGLKDELKSDVRIHKPRTVYSAMSLALEFESKLISHRPGKSASWTPNSKPSQPESKPATFISTPPKNTSRISEAEKQTRFLKGECFRCGDKYGPGHRCKTGTVKVLEADEDVEESPTTDPADLDLDQDQEETAEISLHAILGKSHPTTMKVYEPIGAEITVIHEPDILENSHKTVMEEALSEQLKRSKIPKSDDKLEKRGCYYTKIPRLIKQKGILGQELTFLNLDKTNLLESILMKDYGGVEDLLLAELQFAFVAFLMGQSLEAFLQWKAFVNLLFGCTDAPLHTRSHLFTKFIKVLYYQLKYAFHKEHTDTNGAAKGPLTLLDDSFLSTDSFLQHLCKEFFSLVFEAEVVDGDLLSWTRKLKELLERSLGWVFHQDNTGDGIRYEEDDEFAPVVVMSDEATYD